MEEHQSELCRLQEWYIFNCDGGWEHQYGLRVHTLPDATWRVEIDLVETPLYGRMFSRINSGEGSLELDARVEGGKFLAICGPNQLQNALSIFFRWVDDIHPLFRGDRSVPGRDSLVWLQNWFKNKCNRNWETKYGVKMSTLDNPGWAVKIDLSETGMEDLEVQRTLIDHSDIDWWEFRVIDKIFYGAGDARKLCLILDKFRLLNESDSGPR